MNLIASRRQASAPVVQPLTRVVAYKNCEVVRRFREQFPVSEREAQEIFRETKKWLWLLSVASPPGRLAVTDPILVLDEMWHAFLMYTKDYEEFCQRYFGRVLHHAPTTYAENARLQRRLASHPERVARELEVRSRWQYQTIMEHLGEATLRKWYVSYPKRYSPQKLLILGQRGLRLKARQQGAK